MTKNITYPHTRVVIIYTILNQHDEWPKFLIKQQYFHSRLMELFYYFRQFYGNFRLDNVDNVCSAYFLSQNYSQNASAFYLLLT